MLRFGCNVQPNLAQENAVMRNSKELYVNKLSRLVKNLIDDIKLQTFPLCRIVLFGSFVEGKFTARSDLDICCVYDNELTGEERYFIEKYFRTALGDETDLDFLYATEERVKNGLKVFKSIREEGVEIWNRIGK